MFAVFRPTVALCRNITSKHPSFNMAGLFVNLEAPNGVKYSQPTGLFINNEFVAASSGQTIVSIDPASVAPQRFPNYFWGLSLTYITPPQYRERDCYRPSSRRR